MASAIENCVMELIANPNAKLRTEDGIVGCMGDFGWMSSIRQVFDHPEKEKGSLCLVLSSSYSLPNSIPDPQMSLRNLSIDDHVLVMEGDHAFCGSNAIIDGELMDRSAFYDKYSISRKGKKAMNEAFRQLRSMAKPSPEDLAVAVSIKSQINHERTLH